MEESILRCIRQMSPKKESYPLGAKILEENFRSSTPKIYYSDYYILNPPKSHLSKTKKVYQRLLETHNTSKLASDGKCYSEEKQCSSPVKSEFGLSTTAQTLCSPIKCKMSQDDYLKKVQELESENQKYIEFCNSEIRRHLLEKKQWAETSEKLKSYFNKDQEIIKTEELFKENYQIKEEFRLYKDQAEKNIQDLKDEVDHLMKMIENISSK
ncbi:hypothetical protein SteCoe_11218 [Stentor coeruleus]|uniref:Uncharacterized protein n=1 Tax=Stentor coeruleus TaxID=5963 RepID=A0A1R2CDR6_9CILI|nr:hypothetical protein SteCoe_11218 [Stentor coeruleus]